MTHNNLAQNERIYPRQIAFAAAFLLPAAKLLEVPSLLAKYAEGDLLLPALVHFLFQALVLTGLLYAASKSEIPLIQRMKTALGKGMIAVYIVYGLYFLFAVALPLLDLEKFVYAAFFDTAPTTFAFSLFFFLSAYLCTKGIKSIGRAADLCLFLFLVPFLALVVMSLVATDFSALLPLFSTKFFRSAEAFQRTSPHFSDAVLLLPLIGNCHYKQGDGKKILGGYAVGAAFTLFFLAVFYGVYSSIAPREHYAFSKIAQYFPALEVIGRIDLLFVYFLSVVLFFYTCLPLQYTTNLLADAIGTKRKTWLAAALNFVLLVLVLFLNKHYDGFYAVIGGKLFWVFWIFADLLPLLVLLLPKARKKEVNHAQPTQP